jgi:hypothetical protein
MKSLPEDSALQTSSSFIVRVRINFPVILLVASHGYYVRLQKNGHIGYQNAKFKNGFGKTPV